MERWKATTWRFWLVFGGLCMGCREVVPWSAHAHYTMEDEEWEEWGNSRSKLTVAQAADWPPYFTNAMLLRALLKSVVMCKSPQMCERVECTDGDRQRQWWTRHIAAIMAS